MKTDIEKIFRLLQSNDEVNHALAMQLVQSQGLPKTKAGLLFTFAGTPTHIDKLACLRRLEEQQRNYFTEGQVFWRMYSICDECFDFILGANYEEVNIKVFGHTSKQLIGLLVKMDFLLWNGDPLNAQLKHINGLDNWGKQQLAKELLTANNRLRGNYVYSHREPDRGHWVTIARKTQIPIQHWTTTSDESSTRFYINVYYCN